MKFTLMRCGQLTGASVILASSLLKLGSLSEFQRTIREFGSGKWTRPLSLAIIGVEILVGILSLIPRTGRFGAKLVTIMLGLFSVIAIHSTNNENNVSCSCFGNLSNEPLGWNTAVRNLE